MSSGMYVKGVFVSGIHKQNLQTEMEGCREYLTSIEKKLLMYAVVTPSKTVSEFGEEISEVETVYQSIEELLEEYREMLFRYTMLVIANDSPDDVEFD